MGETKPFLGFPPLGKALTDNPHANKEILSKSTMNTKIETNIDQWLKNRNHKKMHIFRGYRVLFLQFFAPSKTFIESGKSMPNKWCLVLCGYFCTLVPTTLILHDCSYTKVAHDYGLSYINYKFNNILVILECENRRRRRIMVL